MCRAGGRRCKGSHASSQATQNARKQRSRAKQALRHAKASGDQDAIAAAQQRLDQANANVQAAAKENIVHHNDNHETAAHGGDVTTPKAAPTPITGALSDKPLLDNTWGHLGSNSAVHYHDDGPVGTAVKYMGPDAKMDVDGEPLANVVGRIATDVVRRNTKAQQAVDDLKELRDRLPEGSRAKQCLSNAVRNMDGPDTPEPQVPDGTPEPLKDLVRKLHSVPMVRREPETELQPLLKLCDRAAAGDRRTLAMLDDEVKRLRNKRHESLGDSGKFEIDDAISDTVNTLNEQGRRQREQKRAMPTVSQPATEDGGVHSPGAPRPTPGQHGDVTAEAPQPRADDTPRQRPNVTNVVHGENHGYQADVINGGVTIHSSGRITIGDNNGQHRDARYQAERARYQAERTRYQAKRAARTNAPTRDDATTVHTGPHDHTTGGTGPVHITDGDRNTFLQAGNVNGGIWVNGKRVG